MKCNICGGLEFNPGFNGRMANGLPPACTNCKTVERHRIVRKIYEPLRPLLKEWRALQYAPDRSVDRFWFKSFLGSNYGRENSLDMCDTKLPDNSFEIVISNHVLEHVESDRAALKETLRLVGKAGVIHYTVPTPIYRWKTTDWGFADPKINEHYRDYGADFPQIMVREVKGLNCASVVEFDPVTMTGDIVYFFSQSEKTLASMAHYWNRKGIPIVRHY